MIDLTGNQKSEIRNLKSDSEPGKLILFLVPILTVMMFLMERML